jgi:hypothetical protein
MSPPNESIIPFSIARKRGKNKRNVKKWGSRYVYIDKNVHNTQKQGKKLVFFVQKHL